MAEHVAEQSRSRALGRLRFVAPWFGLVLGKLWLVGGQRLTAYGSLTIDDQWFIERASWISSGKWLGPFEYRTLIKQPGYAMFIAAMHSVRLPLLLAEQLLYIFAIAVTIVALHPLLPTRRRQLAAFALLLLNPMTMHTGISARVDRSGVYPAVLILLLSSLVALVTAAGRSTRSTLAWAMAVSVSLGVAWLLREEWLLVLPAVLVGLGLATIRLFRSTIQPLTKIISIAGIALVPMSVVIGTLWLESVNESHYGLAITNVEQTSMSAGLGPMFRVAPVTSFEQFPITIETRQRIYTVSPHFAALREEIEQRTDQRYFSLRPDGVRDLGGQVFQWVVLDAIGASGGATSARQLDSGLRSIGNEIDAACADHRLRCGGPQSGIAPAWQWSRLPRLAARTTIGLIKTVDLRAFTALSSPGDGTAADRATFERMTNEPLAPGPNDFFTRQRVHLIGATRWPYRLLLVATLLAAAGRCVVAVRQRRAPSLTMATIVSVGFVLLVGRTAGLAYLDLTAFPAFAPTYLATGYAITLVVAAAIMLGQDPPHELTEVPIPDTSSQSQ